jgi:hypothetical protein
MSPVSCMATTPSNIVKQVQKIRKCQSNHGYSQLKLIQKYKQTNIQIQVQKPTQTQDNNEEEEDENEDIKQDNALDIQPLVMPESAANNNNNNSTNDDHIIADPFAKFLNNVIFNKERELVSGIFYFFVC